MRARALQMSTAAWLLFAAALMAGTLGRTIRLPRVTWNEPSTAVVERAERPVRRVAAAPTPSAQQRSKADHAEKEKAAAMLVLLLLGQNRVAAASR